MSAVSASVPSAPIVSIATMGGGSAPRGLPGSAPGTPSAGSGSGKCCENGRPVSTDPLTGQTICSCQYNPGALLMAASCYPRGVGVPGLTEAYSSSYATAAMQGLLPGAPGADPTGFYSGMGAFQGPGYYTYDPFGGYPYGNGRKNATRESTQTLKAWLSEHRKNPYPTKGEKIMLAIITKMTLTQVSTWFANARRRLKKENKMTWSPRNRCGEDDDDLDNDDLDPDDDKLQGHGHHGHGVGGDDNDTNNNRDFNDTQSESGDVDILGNCPSDRDGPGYHHPGLHGAAAMDFKKMAGTHCSAMSKKLLSEDCSDINVLDDDDRLPHHHPHHPKDPSHKVGHPASNLGSAFTLVSPRGMNGHHMSSLSPHSQISPHHASNRSHGNSKEDSLLLEQRMRGGKASPPPQVASPSSSNPSPSPSSTATSAGGSQKPKIWSMVEVLSNKSPTAPMAHSERSPHSPPSRSPPSMHLNGHGHPHPPHLAPHPAFPAPPPGHTAGPAHTLGMAAAARGLPGLWNHGVVTSLAGMARYHPYSQGLLSGAAAAAAAVHGAAAGRSPFQNGALPAGIMPPGLIGSPHGVTGLPSHGHPGATTAASSGSQPTDLRKGSSSTLLAIGRAGSKSPEDKEMTSSSSTRMSPQDGATRSRSSSPPTVTAFKPVSRS